MTTPIKTIPTKVSYRYERLQVVVNYPYGVNTTAYLVEIFNAFRCFADMRKDPDLAAGYKPYDLFNVQTGSAIALTPSVVWGTEGELLINKDASLDILKIDCYQTPYRSLLESIKAKPIFIKSVRITGSNPAQTVQSFLVRQWNLFGKYKDFTVYPESYKAPTNVQDNIVDVPLNLTVNGFTSIVYQMQLGQTVNLDFEVRV